MFIVDFIDTYTQTIVILQLTENVANVPLPEWLVSFRFKVYRIPSIGHSALSQPPLSTSAYAQMQTTLLTWNIVIVIMQTNHRQRNHRKPELPAIGGFPLQQGQ